MAMHAGGAMIARNPVAVGGCTAFLVSFCFVSANALWYQPQSHPSALLPTRALEFTSPEPAEALPAFRGPVRPPVPEKKVEAPAPTTIADPVVAEVQEILRDLRLYDGPVDGIPGSRTRDAIRNYQRVVGLEQNGAMDETLLSHLGARSAAAAAPVPLPRPEPGATASIVPAPAAQADGDTTVSRIQSGLRAFGNRHIEIDGIAGAQTTAAIREFQALFGLAETGNPDAAVLTKMQELGLAD